MVYENSAPNNGMTIQVLDDQSIDLLDSYAKKSRQDIDFDALRAAVESSYYINMAYLKHWRRMQLK